MSTAVLEGEVSGYNSCALIATQIDSIKLNFGHISETDYFELDLCYAAQTLAKLMAKDEVMLLPNFRGLFEDYVMEGLADCVHLNVTKLKIPTNRWIITKLHSYIGELVAFQCIHRHVGTIIYHKNCNLLKAISTIT